MKLHFRNRLWQFVLLGATTCLAVWLLQLFSQSSAYRSLEQLTFWLGDRYEQWFSQQSVSHPILLPVLAFLGGLVASVSPCILSLLPVNLSYIGTRQIKSRRDAFVKAGGFVLGVVTVLSLLGLFSAIAAIVLVKFRGYFHVVVGSLIMLMGLSLAGLIRLPLLQLGSKSIAPAEEASGKSPLSPVRAFLTGTYSVGVTFALVSSPCTSPVMFAVLAAAAATGSQVQSVLTMISYALGYTAIIFFASLFTGLAKQTKRLLTHSEMIIRVASGVLVLVGAVYWFNGARWIAATLAA